MIVYSCLVIVCVCTMNNVHSQVNSIYQRLQIEQDQLNQVEQRIQTMKNDIVSLISCLHSEFFLTFSNVNQTLIVGVLQILFLLFMYLNKIVCLTN